VAQQTRLGVLGWPVGHSRSPQMQNAALQEVGLTDWRYQLLPVPPELLGETVRALPGAGFRGANVTVPHKEAALTLADAVSDGASAIGAANTLLFEPDGTIVAENTDAPGLIEALPDSPEGQTVQVLGAGGSARAVVWALLDAGAERVSVWNRTEQRARELSEDLGARAVSRPQGADLLVNCTTIGLESPQQLKELPLPTDWQARYVCVVDLVYAPQETELISAARQAGLRVVDGLELLLAQGALSFERFTGKAAPRDVMRAAVKSPV
jgi:shikimate dehydrogenase